MAKKKRSAARAAAAAVDSAEASKKAKPDVHEVSFTVIWPLDTSPQFAILDAAHESRRAARTAEAEATREEKYGKPDFGKFAKRFEAAVASAFAETRGPVPVTLNAVITKMTKMTGKVKIGKQLLSKFVWRGFQKGRWEISRLHQSKGVFIVYSKGTAMPGASKLWRFSPSSAARRQPLADLSK